MRYTEMHTRLYRKGTSMHRPIRYAGSKWRTMDTVMRYLPPHLCSIEPFAGSAAFTLSKAPASTEIINDTNGLLLNFWRVVKYQGDELARRMALNPWSRALFREWVALLNTPDQVAAMITDGKTTGRGNLDLAEAWCGKTWQALATSSDCHGWHITLSHNGSIVAPTEIADRLRQATIRLQQVFLEDGDAYTLIERYAHDTDTLLFCDPPYLKEVCGSSKMYADDYTIDDHMRLLDLITHPETKAKIIISSYPNPLYAERLAEWSTFTVSTNRMVSVSAKNERDGASKRVEQFWYNYPLPHTTQVSFF